MGKDIAFAVEKFEKDQWQIEGEWIKSLLKDDCFYPLELLQYSPSHPVYTTARMSEFVAIICGDGNTESDAIEDEFWCTPITQSFGLPSDLSNEVLEEFNNSSDPDNYGKPVCITLKQLVEYDFTIGWINRKQQQEPFSISILKRFTCLITELLKIGSPNEVRLIFWFF